MNMAKKTKKTREQIHDELISPLVSQIIGICKKHKIPMLANFNLASEDDEGLQCTTHVFGDDWESTEAMRKAAALLGPRASSVSMLTVRDGNGEITKMVAFVD
jgi:hypothetical protein